MKKFIAIAFLLFNITIGHAQWAIKESQFKGSHLESIHTKHPYLVHVIPDQEWDSSNFATNEDIQWFKDAKFGMYIHFGLSTFVNQDLSWGMAKPVFPDPSYSKAYPKEVWTTWKDSLILDQYDLEDFKHILKETGVKYVMIVAKHHDGFHLWDTQFSDFKSTNTPYGKDFIKETLDACREAGVKVGVYYSQRDWYHPDYEPIDTTTINKIAQPPYFQAKDGQEVKQGISHKKYMDYQFQAVRELCTKYGKLDMFNFDANYWNGMYTADMWDSECLTRMIRRLQPGIIINNRASIPGDYDSPEQRIGVFQNNRPWETCMSLCDTWSYSPTRIKSSLELFQNLQSSVVADGNVLLSWGMEWSGKWNLEQKEAFLGVGDYLKKYEKSIYSTNGGPWLPENWGGSTYSKDKIYIHITKIPVSKEIRLEKSTHFKVVNSITLSPHKVRFKESDSSYILDLSKIKELKEPLIIQLEASKPITSKDIMIMERSNEGTDQSKWIKTIEINSSTQIIDLEQTYNIDKLTLKANNLKEEIQITVSTSINNKEWRKQTVFTLKDTDMFELPIQTFSAGILKNGVEAKYLKLETASSTKLECKIYGTQ